jgi:hypothetical protein
MSGSLRKGKSLRNIVEIRGSKKGEKPCREILGSVATPTPAKSPVKSPLKGSTPFLQLGIKDVFEPRLADLSPMTPDLGVYARDVQQSIAVNIRNYMKEDAGGNGTKTDNNGGSLGAQLILPPRRDDYRFQRPGITPSTSSFSLRPRLLLAFNVASRLCPALSDC